MTRSPLSRTFRWCCFAALAALPLAGCGDGPSGEFKEFGEITRKSPPPAPEESAEQQSDEKRQAEAEQSAESESVAAASDDAASPAASTARADAPVAELDDEHPAPPSRPEPASFRFSDSVVKRFTDGASSQASINDAVEAEKPAVAAGSASQIKLLIPEREFRVEGPENALRVSYDDLDLLKVLNMDPVVPEAPELLPDWLKELDGKRIRIRGFMYPTFQDTGLRSFLLARDTQICCFGREPKLYDVFSIRMREGKTADYIQLRPFDVVGIFRISDKADFQLYSIEDAIIIEK